VIVQLIHEVNRSGLLVITSIPGNLNAGISPFTKEASIVRPWPDEGGGYGGQAAGN
jgi:hypothetical protein